MSQFVTFQDQALEEIFQQELRKRGLKDLHTIYIDACSTNRIADIYKYLKYPEDIEFRKYPSADLAKELKKHKIINKGIYAGPFKATAAEDQKEKTIWPRNDDRYERYLSYDLREATIVLPNQEALNFWKIYKSSKSHEGDSVWYFLSFKPELRKDAINFLNLLSKYQTEYEREIKRITVFGAPDVYLTDTYSWDDLVLPEYVINSVKDDLEFFISMEKEYRKNRIPFRRGYLFEGPPGNGKTAVTRIIAANYDFRSYMFNFSNPRLDGSDLETGFARATENAPSLFILEDIDRLFAEGAYCNVNLSELLNCLDGIVVHEGVVVIATTNHPKMLDPAIRQRPGRFDVPVTFSNPDADLRRRYFNKLLAKHNISDKMFLKTVDETEGLSMAFLKLVYESAGVKSFKRCRSEKLNITDEDLEDGLYQALRYYKNMETAKERKIGFGGGTKENKVGIREGLTAKDTCEPCKETVESEDGKPYGPSRLR